MGDDSSEPVKKKAGRPPKKSLEKELDETVLFLTGDERACVHISIRDSRETAASRLNWTNKQVNDCLNRPHVKAYALRFSERCLAMHAEKEVTADRARGVSPANIQKRLMDIAMMSPSETKGSVDGQVKALQELAAQLGLKKDDPLTGKSIEELEEIRDRGLKKTAPTVQ